MGSSSVNLDQVLFARAKWRLKLLAPCWIFQIAVLLSLMGIFAYRLAETAEHYDEDDKNGRIPMVELVWESTNVAFSTVALVCTIIEISKMVTETLTPFAMMCTHVLKLTLALVMLGLDVTIYIQRSDRNYSIIGLALDLGFLAVAIGTFVYSLQTFRRLLKYEKYHLTENAKLHGGGHDIELGNSNSNSSSNNNNNALHPFSDKGGVTLDRSEIDRHIGAEFGWSTPLPGAGVERTTSVVVAKGVVPSSKASPTQAEMDLRRSRSYVTGRGVVGRDDGVSDDDDDDDDDGTETVRGSRDIVRHSSIPVVVVSPQDEEEEDTRALLSGEDHGLGK